MYNAPRRGENVLSQTGPVVASPISWRLVATFAFSFVAASGATFGTAASWLRAAGDAEIAVGPVEVVEVGPAVDGPPQSAHVWIPPALEEEAPEPQAARQPARRLRPPSRSTSSQRASAPPVSEPSPVPAEPRSPTSGRVQTIDSTETTAEDVVASGPQPLPTILPSEPIPATPELARSLSGTFVGKANGKACEFQLDFGPRGSLAVTMTRENGDPATIVGNYFLGDGEASVSWSDRSADDAPQLFAGSVSARSLNGQIMVAGKRVGKFKGTR